MDASGWNMFTIVGVNYQAYPSHISHATLLWSDTEKAKCS